MSPFLTCITQNYNLHYGCNSCSYYSIMWELDSQHTCGPTLIFYNFLQRRRRKNSQSALHSDVECQKCGDKKEADWHTTKQQVKTLKAKFLFFYSHTRFQSCDKQQSFRNICVECKCATNFHRIHSHKLGSFG